MKNQSCTAIPSRKISGILMQIKCVTTKVIHVHALNDKAPHKTGLCSGRKHLPVSVHGPGEHRIGHTRHLIDQTHHLGAVTGLIVVPDVEYHTVTVGYGSHGVHDPGMA